MVQMIVKTMHSIPSVIQIVKVALTVPTEMLKTVNEERNTTHQVTPVVKT